MRIRYSVFVAAAALLAAMIVPGMALAHGTHQKAKMSGSKVVGQPGAPNGEGTAKLHLLRGKGRVCFTIKYSGIRSRDGLNIGVYRGKKDQNGAEKIVLVNKEKKDPIHGCVNDVANGLLRKMTRSPHRFHVNLKTDAYPVDGAMRGQLKAL
jgi:CHRD domain